jgi:hypothetical protein
MTDQAGAHTPEKPRAVSPCPFYGTFCEYVPMAHSAQAMTEELAHLRAQKAQLVEALKAITPPTLCGESWNLTDTETVEVTATFGNIKLAREAILAAERK